MWPCPRRVAVACLLMMGGVATSSSPATCVDGETSYASFVASSARTALDSLVLGAFVGARSDDCSLEITPSSETFSIWSFIYTQQAALLLPNALSDAARHHVLQLNDASAEWYRAFVGGGDGSPNNSDALAAIGTMRCHARKARDEACGGDSEFACCAFSQYEAWLRVAELLSELIVDRYGDSCGDGRADGEARTLARFATGFGAVVADPPAPASDGAHGAARRAWFSTLAWAWRGVCDARDGGACPPVNVSAYGPDVAADLAAADAMSKQSRLALRASLVCAPAEGLMR